MPRPFMGYAKCKCLWCKHPFTIRICRLMDTESKHKGWRRGVACSRPCAQKLWRSWLMAGMKRDEDFQALMRERAKLRALVKQHLRAA